MIEAEGSNRPVVLLGNKCDLEARREVSRREAGELAREHGWSFLEVSAKGDLNVTEAFQLVAGLAYFHGVKNEKALLESAGSQV
jgi:GTPase SAR1 family protein